MIYLYSPRLLRQCHPFLKSCSFFSPRYCNSAAFKENARFLKYPYFGLKPNDKRLPYPRIFPPQRQLLLVLNSLKCGSSQRHDDIYYDCLYFLPYFSYSASKTHEFVDVIEIWWRQFRPYVSKNEVKIPSLFIHLGKLQQDYPDISIIEKIGGLETVDFLLQRMIDIGFHRFPWNDINSGLSGLLLLITDPSSERLNSIYAKGLRNFRTFLHKAEEYILRKSPADPDWNDLVQIDAVVTVSLLRKFELTSPPAALLSKLVEFCRMAFDTPDSRLDFDRFTEYADAFVWFDINPDTLAAGSWDSWYSALRRRLDEWNDRRGKDLPPINIMGMSFPIEVASKFGKSKTFTAILESWRLALRLYFSGDDYTKCENIEKHMANLIYNLGLWTSQNRPAIGTAKSILDTMELLQTAFLKTDIRRVSPLLIQRLLSGFMYVKRNADMDDQFGKRFQSELRQLPSQTLLDTLERCYVDGGRDNGRIFTVANCIQASEMLLLLKRLDCRPSPVLIGSLLSRIDSNLDAVDVKRIEKVLCYSGEACSFFSSAFMDADEIQAPFNAFWHHWFASVEKFLQNPLYSSSEDANLRLGHLLLVIVEAADSRHTLVEFRRLQPLWEKRARQFLDHKDGFKEKTRKKIYFGMRAMIETYKWTFDEILYLDMSTRREWKRS